MTCAFAIDLTGMDGRLVDEYTDTYETETEHVTKNVKVMYFSAPIYELEDVPDPVIHKINTFEEAQYKPRITPEAFTTYDDSVGKHESFLFFYLFVFGGIILLGLSGLFFYRVVWPTLREYLLRPKSTPALTTSAIRTESDVLRICNQMYEKGYSDEHVEETYKAMMKRIQP